MAISHCKYSLSVIAALAAYVVGWRLFTDPREWVTISDTAAAKIVIHSAAPTSLGTALYTFYLPMVVCEIFYLDTMHVYDFKRQFTPGNR